MYDGRIVGSLVAFAHGEVLEALHAEVLQEGLLDTIKELQSTGIVNKEISPEPLMTVFKQMIKFQLQKENDRIEGKLPNSHAKDWKYTRKKEIPNF